MTFGEVLEALQIEPLKVAKRVTWPEGMFIGKHQTRAAERGHSIVRMFKQEENGEKVRWAPHKEDSDAIDWVVFDAP